MTKQQEMAAALREAARLIETMDAPVDCMVSVAVAIHPNVLGEEARGDLKRVLRSFPKAKFDSYQGSTWAVYRLPADDAKINVFFSKQLMEKQ